VLPESQLDRFLLRISMGYPEHEFEMTILTSHRDGEPVDHLPAVASVEEISAVQNAVRHVKVDSAIAHYLMDVIHATRNSPDLSVGVSTRGALLWYRGVQAMAFAEGRNYATPDDAKQLAIPVIAHRVKHRGMMQQNQRETIESVIRTILSDVPSPN
jgi:MoxR-like ATPase